MHLSEKTLRALEEKGFTKPSDIQSECIPLLLEKDKDVIGQARTGSGKTAAFTIPILEKISERKKHIQAIVLTPTRELAMQEVVEMKSLSKGRDINILAIYGGASIREQLRALKGNPHIIVGTPGRVIDFINRRVLDLSKIEFAVLDEADEMLNMGFIDDISTILSQTPDTKRMLFFSATMPKPIVNLAKTYMQKDYEIVKIHTENQTKQYYYLLKESDKLEALSRIIDVSDDFYSIVFCKTKLLCDEVGRQLIDKGYNAEVLHGDLSQSQRELILKKLRRKQINILVATDVAARGIDIPDLSHVINYNIPYEIESYIHRIGRTGRAGKTGVAISFVNNREISKIKAIERAVNKPITKAIIPDEKQVISIKKDSITTRLNSIIESNDYEKNLVFALKLLENNEPAALVAALLSDSYANELDIKKYKKISVEEVKAEATRIRLDVGKRHGLTKKILVEIICDNTRLNSRDIDKVEVSDTSSFLSLENDKATYFIDAINSNRSLKIKASTIGKAKNHPEKQGFRSRGRDRRSRGRRR